MRAPSQGTHVLPGQVVAGKACGRQHRERIRRPSWWECHRGPRPRTMSQAAHPTVVAANRAEKERPRTPSRGTPSGANTVGRSTRASGVVPPNQRMQPDAVPATEIVPILEHRFNRPVITIAGCGAADAPGVGRARAAYLRRSQHTIQPRDCCSLTANARESGIRPPSRGTHALPGQASTWNALGRHPKSTHPAAIVVGTPSQAAPSGAIAGKRIRPPSRPAALKRNALGLYPRPRPRAPTWPAGQRGPPAWCRPTSASSRRRSGDRDRRDCSWYHGDEGSPDLSWRRG
jgi:hypothetical protein